MLAPLGARGVLLCFGEVFLAGGGKLLGGEWGWSPETVNPTVRHPESKLGTVYLAQSRSAPLPPRQDWEETRPFRVSLVFCVLLSSS